MTPPLPHTPLPRRRLYRHDELHTLPPPAWLVEPLVPCGGLTVLFGPSGAGKSFVALDLAAHIASSRHPLQPVIYVAAEGAAGYSARVQAWQSFHKTNPGALCFWLEAINLLNPAELHSFMDEIHTVRPALIIIDTLARCMWGDENSARDMGMFIQACNTLQRDLSAAVLVVHHTGKSGTSERGSSALRGAADMMLELTNDDGLIRMICSKAKDTPDFEPRHYKLIPWEVTPPMTSCVIVPTSRRAVPNADRLSPIQLKIMETLALEVFAQHGARATVLQSAARIEYPTSFYRAASRLLKRGFIRKSGKHDPYCLTQEGRLFLEHAD